MVIVYFTKILSSGSKWIQKVGKGGVWNWGQSRVWSGGRVDHKKVLFHSMCTLPHNYIRLLLKLYLHQTNLSAKEVFIQNFVYKYNKCVSLHVCGVVLVWYKSVGTATFIWNRCLACLWKELCGQFNRTKTTLNLKFWHSFKEI